MKSNIIAHSTIIKMLAIQEMTPHKMDIFKSKYTTESGSPLLNTGVGSLAWNWFWTVG